MADRKVYPLRIERRLYDALATHGLTIPAGCGPSVGIAGLTLGGGRQREVAELRLAAGGDHAQRDRRVLRRARGQHGGGAG